MLPGDQSSEYEFKLCTSATDLCAAYDLRIEIFHKEQNFPRETEVDSYDPHSAHFIVTSRKNSDVVATVRLHLYPIVTSAVVERQERENFPLGAVRSENDITDQFSRALSVEGSHGGCVKLSRLAVKKTVRSKGIGLFTMREAEKWLLKTLDGLNDIRPVTIILSSQMQAKGFYEKIGYVVEGEPYDEEGAPHILCRKELIRPIIDNV